MLKRLLELKDFCKEIEETTSEVKLSDFVWEQIKNLCDALQPFNDTTVKIQHQQLTISDFYGEWLRCKRKLESIDSVISKKLLEHMRRREEKIFKNEVLLSCVLLDPRYSFLLTLDEINMAKRHLTQLYYVINSIKDGGNKNNNVTAVTTCNSDESIEVISTIDDFESMLDKEEKSLRSNRAIVTFDSPSINIDFFINEYIEKVVHGGPRLVSSTNILDYWKKQKKEKPEMYKLSQVLMAVPATQVSVERLFSNLAFIYNPLRSRLSENVLESIILIRSNQNFKS